MFHSLTRVPRSPREPRPDSKQQLAQKRDHRPLHCHTPTGASYRDEVFGSNRYLVVSNKRVAIVCRSLLRCEAHRLKVRPRRDPNQRANQNIAFLVDQVLRSHSRRAAEVRFRQSAMISSASSIAARTSSGAMIFIMSCVVTSDDASAQTVLPTGSFMILPLKRSISATASSTGSVSISLASTSTFLLFRLTTGLPCEDVALQLAPLFFGLPRYAE
jgi:hypothetical protein